MPLSNVLVITGIVAAFLLFGIVLAWADYQTSRARRDQAKAPAAQPEDFKKAA